MTAPSDRVNLILWHTKCPAEFGPQADHLRVPSQMTSEPFVSWFKSDEDLPAIHVVEDPPKDEQRGRSDGRLSQCLA